MKMQPLIPLFLLFTSLSCTGIPENVRPQIEEPGGTMDVQIGADSFAASGEATGTLVLLDEEGNSFMSFPMALTLAFDADAGTWQICPSIDSAVSFEYCWTGELTVAWADDALAAEEEAAAAAAEEGSGEAPDEGSGDLGEAAPDDTEL
jgi:hypothetical protein